MVQRVFFIAYMLQHRLNCFYIYIILYRLSYHLYMYRYDISNGYDISNDVHVSLYTYYMKKIYDQWC